ncbi:MAG TPA: zinc-ribbon domain-containing protein [Bryobacteraceae bacterium]|nr:zinc-ribbon domain-containing protein [Bryobacteraceae bacterium]
MALIQFVRNYDDLSTDRGYQFKFHCDKCGNGFMTQFKPSTLGMAQGLFSAASSFLGGWGNQAGHAAYEVQRSIGGKAHDSALAEAVEEARPNFRQCTRCGIWVCKEVCWNEKVNQCENCAPNFDEQMAAHQAQAKAEAARQQLWDKARQTDYVKDVDMSAGAYVSSATAATNVEEAKTLCKDCGANVGSAKFCPECGKPVQKGPTFCPQCGAKSTGAKFCGDCGHKFS